MEEKEDIYTISNKLYEDIQKLNNHYNKTAYQRCLFLGDVGEIYTKCCVELGMLRLGIPNNQNRMPSYKLVKTDLEARIDFTLELIDRCNQPHSILIEAKNWGLYRIPKQLIEEKITGKFTEYNTRQLKLIAMSVNGRVNSKDLECSCIEKTIHILEMGGQIDENTGKYLLRKQMRQTTKQFVEKIKPYIDCKYKKTIDKIKRDLRDGRQIWFIASTYSKPKWYIWRVRDEMIEDGEDIPKVREERLRDRETGKYIKV